MEFNEMDVLLLDHWKDRLRRLYTGCHSGRNPEALWYMTELLWAGKHYLLVRQGPYQGERDTMLLNREALLLDRGNRWDDNAMIELALASIHPVHRREEILSAALHVSRTKSKRGHEPFVGKRWSKKLVRELIAFVEIKDVEFPEKEAEWIRAFDIQSGFAEEVATYATDAFDGDVEYPIEKDGVRFPINKRYEASIDGRRSGEFMFTPRATGRVSCRLQTTSFSKDEFKLLIDSMEQIRESRFKAQEMEGGL